jgi:arginase
MRNFVVLDAPSNLGLRPPAPGTVPGCYKLAGALREQHIVRRLNAREGGVVVPPRYDRGSGRRATACSTRPPSPRTPAGSPTVSSTTSAPVTFPSCSAATVPSSSAPPRAAPDRPVRTRRGRRLAGLSAPGNSDRIGAAGGEEVALATGRGQDDLTDLEGLKPYLRDEDIRLFGIRDYFEDDRAELAALKIPVVTVGELREGGPDTLGRATAQSFTLPSTPRILGPLGRRFPRPVRHARRRQPRPRTDSCPTNSSASCARCWPPRTASASTSPSTTPISTPRAARARSSPTSSYPPLRNPDP